MRVIVALAALALLCVTVHAVIPTTTNAGAGKSNGFWIACSANTDCSAATNPEANATSCSNCICDTYFRICVQDETTSNNGSFVAISDAKERRTGELYYASYLSDGSSAFRPKSFKSAFYRLAPSNLQDTETVNGMSQQTNDTYTTNIVLHVGLLLDISNSVINTVGLANLKTFAKSFVTGVANIGSERGTTIASRKVYFTLATFDRSTVPNFLAFQTTDSGSVNSLIDGITGPRYRGSAIYSAVNSLASVMRYHVRSFGSSEALVAADAILQVIVVVTDGYSNTGSSSFNSDTTGFYGQGNFFFSVVLSTWGNYDTTLKTNTEGLGNRAKFLNRTNILWGSATDTFENYGTNLKNMVQIFVDNVVVSEICPGATFSDYSAPGSLATFNVQEFPNYYGGSANSGVFVSNVDVLYGAATSNTGGRQCAALQTSDSNAIASAASSTIHPVCLSGTSTPYSIYICQIFKGVYCGGCDGFSDLVIPPDFSSGFAGLSNYQTLRNAAGTSIVSPTSTTDNWFLYIVRTSETKKVGLSLSSAGNNTEPLGFRIIGARGSSSPSLTGTYDVYSPRDELVEWTTCGETCRTQQWQVPCGTSAAVSSPRPARAFQDVWYFRVDFCVPHSGFELVDLGTGVAPAKGPLGLLSPNEFQQRRASAIDPSNFKAAAGVSSGVTASLSVFAVLFVSFASYFSKMF